MDVKPLDVLKEYDSGDLKIEVEMSEDNLKRFRETFRLDESEAKYQFVRMALSKQCAVMPEYISDGYAPDGSEVYDTAYCPVCEHEFEEGVNDWGSNYCSDCGQKLDWSCINGD